MCARFTLTPHDVRAVAGALGAAVPDAAALLHRPRWNVAPTDDHWVARLEHGRRVLVRARFGIDAPRGLVINARSETAASLPTFRDAFQHGRCLVPADGFYEWRGGRGARRPVWLHPPEGGLLLVAGLAVAREGALRFVILTTPANATVAHLHDRMPALLSREGADAWLSRPDPTLLVPCPERWLAARDVSSLVNAVANDGPELLETPPPERQVKLL
jgi:putative SOS response-associated peptidase YedK